MSVDILFIGDYKTGSTFVQHCLKRDTEVSYVDDPLKSPENWRQLEALTNGEIDNVSLALEKGKKANVIWRESFVSQDFLKMSFDDELLIRNLKIIDARKIIFITREDSKTSLYSTYLKNGGVLPYWILQKIGVFEQRKKNIERVKEVLLKNFPSNAIIAPYSREKLRDIFDKNGINTYEVPKQFTNVSYSSRGLKRRWIFNIIVLPVILCFALIPGGIIIKKNPLIKMNFFLKYRLLHRYVLMRLFDI
ncbi:hypothetical protein N8Z37_01250 [Octadecabacter sp.]|nr:hypothetical protein [Octadecabacter sp.]